MVLIKNANLMSMAQEYQNNVDILVKDGKIEKIGELDVQNYPSATIIDAKGKLVTPGLVDPHCHIGMHEEGTADAGNDTNEMTDPIVPQVRAIDSIKPQDIAFVEALDAGITSVVTGPGSGEVIAGTFCALKTYGKSVLDMCFKQEVAMKMALGENPKRCFGKMGKLPSTRMGSAAVLREALIKARIYHDKKAAFANGVKGATDPEFDMKMDSLARVFDGMQVKIHAHQQDDIVTALRIIEEFNLNATVDHCTEGYIIPEILKQRNQKIIIGPTLGSRSKIELRNKSFEGGKVYWENGIEFSLMTDHPVVPIAYTLAQASIYVKYGVPATEMLKALTINAARANGIDDTVGSIEVGKDADIVIWSGDPFHYLTVTETILVNGKIVKQIN